MGRASENVTDDMFKPKLIVPKKAKKTEEKEQTDDEDPPAVRAFKKQQAHVEKLYWHEGSTGNADAHDCSCVYGEGGFYKLHHKKRYCTSARQKKKSKEIWARLLRPSSAHVPRKNN